MSTTIFATGSSGAGDCCPLRGPDFFAPDFPAAFAFGFAAREDEAFGSGSEREGSGSSHSGAGSELLTP
jgi:hypothetical protein